jgi:hypothetical protein
MLENLTIRAIVPVAVTVTGFVLVCCILLYSAIKADLTRAAVQHSTDIAETVVKSTRYAMLRGDRETLRNIVDNVSGQANVEHLRIFDKRGLVKFSHNPAETGRFVDKGTAGCLGCHAGPTPAATLEAMQHARRFVDGHGVEVLAITAPIYNEPACATAACHVHPASQQILGILDIGLDTAPLQRSLAVLCGRMAVFTLLVLILTVGGVAAHLRRTVLLPLQALADFTAAADGASLDEKSLRVGGELGAIAANFRILIRRLEHARGELAARHEAAQSASPARTNSADDDGIFPQPAPGPQRSA